MDIKDEIDKPQEEPKMTESEKTKVCLDCGQEKELKYFRRQKKSGKYSDSCSKCIQDKRTGKRPLTGSKPKDISKSKPKEYPKTIQVLVEIEIDHLVDEVTKRLTQRLTG
jgi:hypothetical protein